MDILGIVCIVHNGNLNGDALLFSLQVNDIIEEVRTVPIDIANELFQTILGMKNLGLCLAFVVRAQVFQRDSDACIEVSKLSHTARNDVPFIDGRGEYRRIRPKLLACSAQGRLADNFYRVQRSTLFVFLLIDLAIAEHLRQHPSR